jgi:hypothetical protein
MSKGTRSISLIMRAEAACGGRSGLDEVPEPKLADQDEKSRKLQNKPFSAV